MTRLALSIAILLLIAHAADAQVASGQGQSTSKPDAAKSVYDQIWKFSEWYDDESNPAIEKILFTGRFQVDYTTIDADEGNHSEWNVRRFRLGPRVTFLKKFLFHSEVELNPQEHDPLYTRFTDFYVQWNRSSQLALTVGKQALPFTLDGATSSKELLTIDRSNLSNNMWFPQEYLPGVSVSGKRARWNYRAGVYSAGAMNREFGEFNGGVSTLVVAGYDLTKTLGVKEAVIAANYVFQTADANNTFTRQLDHIGSLNFKMDAGRWGVRGDVTGASGYLGQSDMWGVMAMPYFGLTKNLQAVTRYTFLDSRESNGLRLATYENIVVPGRGDRYNEFYIGGNYYFYGHKLKLQSGVQIADMNDSLNDGGEYHGVSWTTGLRVGW
jgi:phosphate-selective porin OprO and OprP